MHHIVHITRNMYIFQLDRFSARKCGSKSAGLVVESERFDVSSGFVTCSSFSSLSLAVQSVFNEPFFFMFQWQLVAHSIQFIYKFLNAAFYLRQLNPIIID